MYQPTAFFEEQRQARKISRWIYATFILAVLFISFVFSSMVIAVTNAVAAYNHLEHMHSDWPLFIEHGLEFSLRNYALVGGPLILILVLVSLYESYEIRRGGGHRIATMMGGLYVDRNAPPRQYRQCLNMVEEMAIASGMVIPPLYILDCGGINAYTAGNDPSDAVIVVTEGALSVLDREELQGMIGYLFSHILNGDMRTNTHMIGTLSGVSSVGEWIYQSFGTLSQTTLGIMLIVVSLPFLFIAFLGYLAAEFAKSLLLKKRAILADASAVQFTRNPDSLLGALKKIETYSYKSYLPMRSSKIGHMLFCPGRKYPLFDLHPSNLARIHRLDPYFDEAELDKLRADLKSQRQHFDDTKRREKADRRAQAQDATSSPFNDIAPLSAIINQATITPLSDSSIFAEVEMDTPEEAHGWEQAALLCLLFSDLSPEKRQRRLTTIQPLLDPATAAHLATLSAQTDIDHSARLAQLVTLMARDDQTDEQYRQTAALLHQVVANTQHYTAFSYCLTRTYRQLIANDAKPDANTPMAARHLSSLSTVLSMVAYFGYASTQQTERAYLQGKLAIQPHLPSGLTTNDISFTTPEIDWFNRLDDALAQLNTLTPEDKTHCFHAIVATVVADRQISIVEQELLRTLALLLDVESPLLAHW